LWDSSGYPYNILWFNLCVTYRWSTGNKKAASFLKEGGFVHIQAR